MKTLELRKIIAEQYLREWSYPQDTWKWHKDGSVSVNDRITVKNYPYPKLPVKFRKVTLWFDCQYNQLETLEGCPEHTQLFICSNNQLKSLKFAPRKVSNSFYCSKNPGNFTEEDVTKYCKVGGDIII